MLYKVISLNIEVAVKGDNLVLTDKEGGNVIFSKDQIVQKKISMITLGELSKIPKLQIAEIFGYSTRKSYYDIRNAVLNGSIQDLIPVSTGPKSAPKRTKELEVLVIKMRFETDDNVYVITAKLQELGVDVSPRLVCQIIEDYGLSKKKPQ